MFDKIINRVIQQIIGEKRLNSITLENEVKKTAADILVEQINEDQFNHYKSQMSRIQARIIEHAVEKVANDISDKIAEKVIKDFTEKTLTDSLTDDIILERVKKRIVDDANTVMDNEYYRMSTDLLTHRR